LASLSDYSEPKQGELRVLNIDKGIIDKIETYRLAHNEPSAFQTVSDGILNMKCSKTSTMDDYRSYLKHFGQHAVEILKFNMLNTTRKWKFNVYVAKQKVSFNFYIFLFNII
jgi:hypothetical protein